jgi:hypothetical protein
VLLPDRKDALNSAPAMPPPAIAAN